VLSKDFHHAMQMLRKHPGSVIVVITLALGIGASVVAEVARACQHSRPGGDAGGGKTGGPSDLRCHDSGFFCHCGGSGLGAGAKGGAPRPDGGITRRIVRQRATAGEFT
jgi:hypothetical protein